MLVDLLKGAHDELMFWVAGMVGEGDGGLFVTAAASWLYLSFWRRYCLMPKLSNERSLIWESLPRD